MDALDHAVHIFMFLTAIWKLNLIKGEMFFLELLVKK